MEGVLCLIVEEGEHLLYPGHCDCADVLNGCLGSALESADLDLFLCLCFSCFLSSSCTPIRPPCLSQSSCFQWVGVWASVPVSCWRMMMMMHPTCCSCSWSRVLSSCCTQLSCGIRRSRSKCTLCSVSQQGIFVAGEQWSCTCNTSGRFDWLSFPRFCSCFLHSPWTGCCRVGWNFRFVRWRRLER